jgi:rRNA maturation endonuclease Nob1
LVSSLSIVLMCCAIAVSLLSVFVALGLVRQAKRRETFWVKPCPGCGRTVLIAYESCPGCGRALAQGNSGPSAE